MPHEGYVFLTIDAATGHRHANTRAGKDLKGVTPPFVNNCTLRAVERIRWHLGAKEEQTGRASLWGPERAAARFAGRPSGAGSALQLYDRAIWNLSAPTEPISTGLGSGTAVLFASSGMGVNAGGTNPGINAALDRRTGGLGGNKGETPTSGASPYVS